MIVSKKDLKIFILMLLVTEIYSSEPNIHTRKKRSVIVDAVANFFASIKEALTMKLPTSKNVVSETFVTRRPRMRSSLARSRVTKCLDEPGISRSGPGGYFDSAVDMTTTQLIAKYGYPSESHTVVTEDGYVLTLHRIPYSKKNNELGEIPENTVILHHGIFGTSADWVLPGPAKGLPFMLSDAGYDVWLANSRGNFYSKVHLTLAEEDKQFWNFTYHEISQYDLPATIDYIMHKKGPGTKVIYIAHSMGATALLALLATKPEYNNVLHVGIVLGPIVYMGRIKSPIVFLEKHLNDKEFLNKELGETEFISLNSDLINWVASIACKNLYVNICEDILFMFSGFDSSQFNHSLIPRIMSRPIGGVSAKTIIHYIQGVKSLRFQQFDYGARANRKLYGSEVPPDYPLHSITLPIAIFSAKDDWFTSEIGIHQLYTELVHPIINYVVPNEQFNHVDFLWANDVRYLVYERMLEIMRDSFKQSRRMYIPWSGKMYR